MFRLVQMNMLAPMWVDEKYDILKCSAEYKSSDRIIKTLEYMLTLEGDIYCLCEVEEIQMDIITDYLAGSKCECFFSPNRQGFWSQYLSSNNVNEEEWIANGTCIIVKSQEITITDSSCVDFLDGCCAAMCVLNYNNTLITLVSVHFDLNNPKWNEAIKLLNRLEKKRDQICIISGDYNIMNTRIFKERGFVDGLDNKEVGKTTSPLDWNIIDHTMIRGTKTQRVEIKSIILSPQQEDFYRRRDLYEIESDMCSVVHTSGSDHYATISDIYLKFLK